MEEKRVQLGVDIGELSNQLVQVNNLVEQNYQKALQGQTAYNKLLEDTISLLQQQADFIRQLNQNSNGNIQNMMATSTTIGGSNNETESKENDLVNSILEDVEAIWEKFSEFSFPIPVEVVNTPLAVTLDNNGTIGGGGVNGGGQGGEQVTNNQNQSNSGNNLGKYSNAAASMFQKDPNYILAGAVGMIPVVGAGLSQILSKVIGEAEELENASATLRGATGGGSFYTPQSLVSIGLKDADAYLKQAALYSANVNLNRRDFLFEKGFNVGSGTMESLLRSLRQDVTNEWGLDAGGSVYAANYLRNLTDIGRIDQKQVRGYTEDYLSILVELNQKQLETTGESFSLLNGDIIQRLASIDTHFGDPTYLKKLVLGIEGGLRQAQSPQIEALQYYAMSAANPGASLWEMQLMKEDPFRTGSGYLSKFIEGLFQTGSIEDVKFNIKNVFGLGAWQTEYLVNGLMNQMDTEGFDIAKYLEKQASELNFNLAPDIAKISSEAAAATSPNQVLIAEMSNFMARDIGEPILSATRSVVSYVKNLTTTLQGYFSGSMNLTDVSMAILGMKGQNLVNTDGTINPTALGARTAATLPGSSMANFLAGAAMGAIYNSRNKNNNTSSTPE